MKPVFRNHLVVCNWNRRGREVVCALRRMSAQPILVVASDVRSVINDVGALDQVFAMQGDPIEKSALLAADVGYAQSVLVLAREELGELADARSVKIALMVEKIQVTVYTVIELLDLRNKAHFSWTKVDDLIMDQEISMRLFAQGLRHLAVEAQDQGELLGAIELLGLYSRFVSSNPEDVSIVRVSFPWELVCGKVFEDFLFAGLEHRVLPLALVGYRRHEIAPRAGDDAWVSWKSDVLANPPPSQTLSDLWPEWPGPSYEVGVLALAKSRHWTNNFSQAVIDSCRLGQIN